MSVKSHETDALVIGRFQPLHYGHLKIIEKAVDECDRVTIGIGSAQYSCTIDNPFTAEERRQMIDNTLSAEGLDGVAIVFVNDTNSNSIWVKEVESACHTFNVVYSNNDLTRRLFDEAGYVTRNSPIYRRDEYSGKEVRRRMLENDDWKSLVHPEVVKVIENIDGVSRVKTIMSDSLDR